MHVCALILPTRCNRAKARERQRFTHFVQVNCIQLWGPQNQSSQSSWEDSWERRGWSDRRWSWHVLAMSAMSNRFPGLPEFLELPWAPWNCWLTRVKVPKWQCRLGFSNGECQMQQELRLRTQTSVPNLAGIWRWSCKILRTDGFPKWAAQHPEWHAMTVAYRDVLIEMYA